MKVIVDKRRTETKVIDSKLVQYATDEEVVRLIGKVNDRLHRIICELIGNGLELTEGEIQLYTCITEYIKYDTTGINSVSIAEILNAACRVYGKSETTYRRAIANLITVGVIKYANNRSHVALVPKYDVTSINSVLAKFLVIELDSSSVGVD